MPLSEPSAAHLMEALQEFLEKLQPDLSGKYAYEMRIAINLTGILRRESELGPSAKNRQRDRLAALLCQNDSLLELNAQLCQKIRDRAFDTASRDLLEHLRKTALDKLSIDNPTYSAFIRATQTPEKQRIAEEKGS